MTSTCGFALSKLLLKISKKPRRSAIAFNSVATLSIRVSSSTTHGPAIQEQRLPVAYLMP
jgi:hypothetical protein